MCGPCIGQPKLQFLYSGIVEACIVTQSGIVPGFTRQETETNSYFESNNNFCKYLLVIFLRLCFGYWAYL